LEKLKANVLPVLIALSALSVSGSAAFYSVSGLSKLFAGASFAVILMSSSLEISKLVIASLLYQYWDTINKWLRTYLASAVVILVLITSMGIYGFLSAAYQDTYRNLSVKDNKIAFLTQKKDFYESDVLRYDEELNRISENISILSNAKSTGIQVRDTTSATGFRNTISTTELRLSQKRIGVEEENRKRVQSKREIVADSLQKYQLSILTLENNSESTGELGPLQYLSGLTGIPMDKIINVLLLVIIFVFDPLAISLVVAANFAFEQANPKKKYKENLYGEIEEEKKDYTKINKPIYVEQNKPAYTEQEAIDFFDEIEKEIEEEKKEEIEEEEVKEEIEEVVEEKIEEDDGWDIVDEEENVIVQTSQSTHKESIQNQIFQKQQEIEKLGTYISSEGKKNVLKEEIKTLNKKLNNNNDDDETITY